MFLLAVFIVAEVFSDPYRDVNDRIMSFASLSVLFLLAFVLQLESPTFSNTERGSLIFFALVPCCIFLVWLCGRMLHSTSRSWKRQRTVRQLPKWKSFLLKVLDLIELYICCCCCQRKWMERQYHDRASVAENQ